MTQGTSNSFINLGDSSKPASILIEKISDAVEGIFKPCQIKRVAKAEVEADLIRAEGDIAIQDIHRRAMHRFVEEETIKQKNMESITSQALPLLNSNSKPENIEKDWLTNFFDKCRIISDEDMQNLWSKILSGESNVPGTYSKRTVNFLSSLDKSDAALFSTLCNYGCHFPGKFVPLVYDCNHEIYDKNKINFDALTHLNSIGFINLITIGNYSLGSLGPKLKVVYHGQATELENHKEKDPKFDVGSILLTQIGEQLAPICGNRPVDGFKEYIVDIWKKKGYLKEKQSEAISSP